MANAMGGSPLVITNTTANWSANGLPNSMALDVRAILWLTPVSVGDVFTLADADGLVLYNIVAEAAAGNAGNSIIKYFQPRELLLTKPQGWRVSAISSGTVYIWFVTA